MIAQTAPTLAPGVGTKPGMGLPSKPLLLSLAAHAAALLLLPGLQRAAENSALPPLSVILRPAAGAMAPPPQATTQATALALAPAPAAPERRPRPVEHAPAPILAAATPSRSVIPASPASPANSSSQPSTGPRQEAPAPAASASATNPAPATNASNTASATAAPVPSALALEDYGRSLSSLLARQQQYPRLAALRGWEGEVRLRLKVARKGSLVAVQVERSSGYEVLDQQALQLVQGATLPLPPESLGDREFQIVVPVNYRLQPAT
ncbi:MAG TPA: energy transducer TonB [Azospira sp.]|nr:energy transducer TonB [Azospira sp.]